MPLLRSAPLPQFAQVHKRTEYSTTPDEQTALATAIHFDEIISAWFAPGQCVEKPKPFVKEDRLQAWAFCCELDNALEKSSTNGIKAFAQPETEAERKQVIDDVDLDSPAPPFPMLSLGIDQGSDGWSASFFLQWVLALRMIVIVDLCHRGPNDCKLACMEAGLWSFVLLFVPVFNLPWGPWATCKWHEDAKSALAELKRIATRASKVFLLFAPWITQDLERYGGCEDAALLPSGAAYGDFKWLWDNFQTLTVFREKGPELSMGRWFGWHDCALYYLPGWHARLLAYMTHGLRCGWLEKDAAKLVAKVKQLSVEIHKDPAKESVKNAKTEAEGIMGKARRMCKNMMHVSRFLRGDRRNQHKVAMLVETHKPYRKMHGIQAKLNDAASNAEYMAKISTGEVCCGRWSN